jgi:hypothetical protein
LCVPGKYRRDSTLSVRTSVFATPSWRLQAFVTYRYEKQASVKCIDDSLADECSTYSIDYTILLSLSATLRRLDETLIVGLGLVQFARTTRDSECPYGELYARQLRFAKVDVKRSLRHTLVVSWSWVGGQEDLAMWW